MPKSSPQPKQAIASLISYRPSFGKENSDSVIRLSANEGAFGMSEYVKSAIAAASDNLHRYPEIQNNQLHQAIASHYQLDIDKILTSNGSDELISLLTLAYLEPCDEVVMSEYAFLVIPQATRIAGGIPVFAKDENMTVSVDNMLAQISDRTKIVFLVNPNNPTGTMIPMEEVRRLHQSLPPHILLVLDWAYAEYRDSSFSDEAARLVEDNDNVVMIRTFSKLHGLAALRLGWAYCPETILTILASIRGPFSVNQLAAMAGIAAVGDLEFQEKTIQHTRKWIAALQPFLTQLAIGVIPASANFILLHFDPQQGVSAEQAERFFADHHILLRSMKPYQLDDYLRMSIGNDEEMEIVKKVFIALMQKR